MMLELSNTKANGWTLVDALTQTEQLTGVCPAYAFVDNGNKEHGGVTTTVYVARRKRRMSCAGSSS